MTASVSALAGKKREIERKIRVREFVFGVQDGLIAALALTAAATAGFWLGTRGFPIVGRAAPASTESLAHKDFMLGRFTDGGR